MNGYKFIAKQGLKAVKAHLHTLELQLLHSDVPYMIAPEVEPKITALKQAIEDTELVNAWGGMGECIKRLKSIKKMYPELPNKCFAAKLELTVLRIQGALND
ncbi:hypothetical protein [Acinetobacter colistiniresistens]|uniref:hypothetical protein n=1 Tax=Acinetobacter colistiniresistens TaxID=280145 RepID=UPI001250C1EC|nr:hypothetical protein [Acinetobacter colistiniresistens]